jgi:DNA-binding transcriptional LysR family regulator
MSFLWIKFTQCSCSSVAELESFSRAAETLTLPKGSVSRQIQALENRLGTQLLHRTTRRVSLTQDGMVYYERAKDLLANLMNSTVCFSTIPPASAVGSAWICPSALLEI